MWVVVVAWYCAQSRPGITSVATGYDCETGCQRRRNSAKNAAKKTGSATKKETKKAVDGSDASKKPETTPKQDIKSAGSSTKDATKKTGSATKKETKKAVNKSAEKTDEGAKKVDDKTQPK